jgi:ComF family protein
MIEWIRRVRNAVSHLTSACCDLLYPRCCVHCDIELSDRRGNRFLCGDCEAKLGPEAWHGCRRCGSEISKDRVATDHCVSCPKVKLWFDSVTPLGGYHSGLRDVILRMKHTSHDALSAAMGRLLAERRREELAKAGADVVVPIPMFWWRRLRRGKNSPELLACCLAKSLGIPMQPKVLAWRKNTKLQSSLAPSRRFANVRGAFRVCRPDVVKGARVLLVDDVLTTGATCSEAAKMLKEAGAAMVAVAVVARA